MGTRRDSRTASNAPTPRPATDDEPVGRRPSPARPSQATRLGPRGFCAPIPEQLARVLPPAATRGPCVVEARSGSGRSTLLRGPTTPATRATQLCLAPGSPDKVRAASSVQMFWLLVCLTYNCARCTQRRRDEELERFESRYDRGYPRVSLTAHFAPQYEQQYESPF